MPSQLLALLATAAGLLGFAWWYFRPIWRAVLAERVAGGSAHPVPLHCEIGATLMASAATDTTTPAAGPTGPAAAPSTSGRTAPAKKPARKKPTGPDRRTFLRWSWAAAIGGGLAAFGGASIGFLWPTLSGGFGSVIDVGTEDEVREGISEGGGHYEFPAGKMYVVAYDASRDPDGEYAEVTGGSAFMALYQKCVHLGCRVPWCPTSKWFECPCHGSRYNRWGEYEFGPAPRGLDRFPVEVVDGQVMVNTGNIVTGPSRQVGVLGEPPAGAHCN